MTVSSSFLRRVKAQSSPLSLVSRDPPFVNSDSEKYAIHLPLGDKNSNSAHYGSNVGVNTETLGLSDFTDEKGA
jgi:hypothetical protein